jgi:hypothetical protein
MTEEEGKKEDQFGFTREGEALGYISLDQARVLALRHARDNTDFYGPRYANRELVWEELSAEESEDYYRVRLSFRPARGFRGRPGIEEFTIDKTGPIELRQIVSGPQPTTTLKAAVASAGAVIVAGVVVGSLFAAGVFSSSPAAEPQGDIVSVPVTSNSSAQLVSPQGDVTVDLFAGSVEEAIQLLYQPMSPRFTPPLPPEYVAAVKTFDLVVTAREGQTVDSYTFTRPVTITISLTAAEIALTSGVESRMVIQHYHNRRWEPLPTIVDFRASIAQAQVDSLSIFSLTIKEPVPTPIPLPTAILIPTSTFSPIPTVTPTRMPTPTVPPTPTASPTPQPTPAPLLMTQSEVNQLVSEIIAPCKLAVDDQNGLPTTVIYSDEYLGNDFWLVEARWPNGNMSYGTWQVDSRNGQVFPNDDSAQTIFSKMTGGGCNLPPGVTPAVPKPTATPTPTPRPTPTATPRPSSTPRPTLTPFPTQVVDIPSLDAQVVDMRFYESPKENVPYGERVYGRIFEKTTARFINWELRLRTPNKLS